MFGTLTFEQLAPLISHRELFISCWDKMRHRTQSIRSSLSAVSGELDFSRQENVSSFRPAHSCRSRVFLSITWQAWNLTGCNPRRCQPVPLLLTTGPQTTVGLSTVANISCNKMHSFNRNPLVSVRTYFRTETMTQPSVHGCTQFINAVGMATRYGLAG